MRIVRVTAFVLSIVVLSYGSTANAGLVNGGFETGDYTGWTFTGVDPRPFDGVGPRPVEDELGLYPMPPGPPSNRYFASLWSTDYTIDRSTLTQAFETTAPGYVLSFDYFFTLGYYGDDYVDTATATLNGPGLPTDGITLFEHNTLDDQDWTTVVQPLDQEGWYTLTFQILDKFPTNDLPGFESILGVDNVSVVPVPGALLLGALGLGSAGGLLRRLRHGSRA